VASKTKLPRMPSSLSLDYGNMHPIFQIKHTDIRALNDTQARELVARLCQAELSSKSISPSAVTWGGDQRAKDGGVDVRVDIVTSAGISGYVPKDVTVYQVKAETFGPSKIPKEMAPNGILRPSIAELVNQSGAYVIVSTRDDLSDSSLKTRKKAMADCMQQHGLPGKVLVDFYDCRKLADWVENFPAIVIWLRSVLDRPMVGWKPYAPWAFNETNIEDAYLLDDKVKVFTPDSKEGVAIVQAIDRLRGELGSYGTSARIVGLSGVGKTRFAQALLDDRITTPSTVPKRENVLYTDISDNPNPQPIAMLEALSLQDADCLVVIDNCGQETHQKLTEIAKRPGNKIRLITIEYDIRDDLPEGTTCYRLEGSSNEVVAALLKRRHPILSDLDIGKIVEFSDGNARVALALASMSNTKGEFAQLSDDALFQRLFVQKNAANDELQKCAEAASLLYSFDVDDVSEYSELAILASISEVTIPAFLRNVAELQRRGLIQERGKWNALLPHAISNRLALRCVQAYPSGHLTKRLVTDATERVARSFSRRLGYLHESVRAQTIAGEWLKAGGLLGDVTKLNDLKRQMLANIAPVNQRAALDALQRAVQNKDLLSMSHNNRADVARLLRSLAYEEDLFEQAATALLHCALGEPVDNNSNSIRDIFKSLFYMYLSGTLALPEKRAAFVNKLALDPNFEVQEIACILLRTGLQATHFSSSYQFDFGALKRDYGWQPHTRKEAQDWSQLFIGIAVEIGKTHTAVGSKARSVLGSAFRGLWTNAGMGEALTGAARVLMAVDGWPDGWVGIRKTLQFDKTGLPRESVDALLSLERELAPRDLLAKIRAKVLASAGYDITLNSDSEGDSRISQDQKAEQEAEALGVAAALDANALTDLGPYLLVTESMNRTLSFGIGVGRSALGTLEILERIKQTVIDAKIENPNIPFLRGILVGWSKNSPTEVADFFDKAIYDETWGPIFPDLQVAVGLDDVSVTRLVKCLAFDYVPSWRYRYLGYGRATDSLSITQLASLLNPLARRPDNGFVVAIDILYMVVSCADEKSQAYRSELQIFCLAFFATIDWEFSDINNQNNSTHLQKIIEFGLSGSLAGDGAAAALNNLVDFGRCNSDILEPRLGELLAPFFKSYPEIALEACYFLNSEGDNSSSVRMVSKPFDKFGDTAVGATPEEALIDWCKLSVDDRCVFAARTCTLFEKSLAGTSGDVSPMGITDIAKSVLKLAINKKKVFEVFMDRFLPGTWSGSRSTIMRQRLSFLDQFISHEDHGLNTLIEAAKARFTSIISSDEKQEQDWEKSRTTSFE
jgi:hypothetical protein